MIEEGAGDDVLVERQRAHFDVVAERYRLGRLEKNHIALKNMIWDDALRIVETPSNGTLKVLEPMCGFAEGEDILASRLNEALAYEGFDYSDEVVHEALRRKPHANIYVADVTCVTPVAESYDIIILIGGLHHVPRHADTVVKSMANAMKPGGLFINFEPTSGNPVFQAIRQAIYRRNEMFDEETERAFSVNELFGFFENAGLKRYSVSYPGLLAYILYYNPYAFPHLNIGGERAVRWIFGLERLFRRNLIGRMFSFATLSIWRKAG